MYPFNPLLTRSNLDHFYIPLASQKEIADWLWDIDSPRVGFLNQPLAVDKAVVLKECCNIFDGVICAGMVVAGVWFEYVGSEGEERNYYILTDNNPKAQFVPAPTNDGTLRLHLPVTLKINNCEIPVMLSGVYGIDSTSMTISCEVPECAVDSLCFVGYDLKAKWTILKVDIP